MISAFITVQIGAGMRDEALDEMARLSRLLGVAVRAELNNEDWSVSVGGTALQADRMRGKMRIWHRESINQFGVGKWVEQS